MASTERGSKPAVPAGVIVALASLPVLALTLRSWSFFWTDVGKDEGLYLLMARDLLAGHLPYTTLFDNKTPGIYVLFALAVPWLGPPSLFLRLVSWLAVTATAYAVVWLVLRATGGRWNIAILAGIGYVVYTAHWRGLEANTEIFFVPFVVAAFALNWPTRSREKNDASLPRAIAGGVLVGIASCIKPVAVFDATALAISLALFSARKSVASGVLAFAASLVVAPAGVALVYAGVKRFDLLYQCVVAANLRRVAAQAAPSALLRESLLEFYRSFPLPELVLASPLYLRAAPNVDGALKRSVAVALIWLGSDVAGAAALGQVQGHYTIPLLPPMLVIGSIVFCRSAELWIGRGSTRRAVVGAVLLAILALQSAKPIAMSIDTWRSRARGVDPRYADRAALVGTFLSSHLQRGDSVFIMSADSTMEYFLSGGIIPTRYALSDFIWNPDAAAIPAIHSDREIDSILQRQPRLIALQPPRVAADLVPPFEALAADTGVHGTVDPRVEANYAYALAKMAAAYREIAVVDGVRIFVRAPGGSDGTSGSNRSAGRVSPHV